MLILLYPFLPPSHSAILSLCHLQKSDNSEMELYVYRVCQALTINFRLLTICVVCWLQFNLALSLCKTRNIFSQAFYVADALFKYTQHFSTSLSKLSSLFAEGTSNQRFSEHSTLRPHLAGIFVMNECYCTIN